MSLRFLLCLFSLYCATSPGHAYSETMNRMKIRVASYNVLSSHLASADFYSTLNPEHLKASNRLPVVLQKIEDEVQKKSIICLQEVSYDWAGEFHTYFANKGYHVVSGLYGKKFNGYMGCMIAWPTATMSVLNVDISRLSDKREGGWPREPRKGLLMNFVSGIWSVTRQTLQDLGVLGWPPHDHWAMAENRMNVILSVKLQEKQSRKEFYTSTYHMPCVYYAPMVMSIHAELAAQHLEKLAGDCPYILAGDWNIKPRDSVYDLLTTGKMDANNPDWPIPKNGMEWKPIAKPLKSAYAESAHGEPDFTNYARIKKNEPFVDTLDYIFYSQEWKVEDVKPLPKRDESGGPFPNLDVSEPSDHILIAAELSLP